MVHITDEASCILSHLDDRAAPLRGTEVGVLRARTSVALLDSLPRLHLSLVDNWKAENQGPACPEIMTEALTNLRPYAGRFRVYKMGSLLGANRLANKTQDFIFIDADHTHPTCYYDIQAYWPKLKVGGIMFVHDIDHEHWKWKDWDVRESVEQWCHHVQHEFQIIRQHHMAVIRKER